MRAILLIVLALAGCGSDENVAVDGGNDIGIAGDLPLPCVGDLARSGRDPIPCGSSSCPGTKICMIMHPGVPPFDDGGLRNSYSCEDVPAACACTAGCGTTPSPAGCFASLCPSGLYCSYDGATLDCYGI